MTTRCKACNREFKNLRDFPAIRVGPVTVYGKMRPWSGTFGEKPDLDYIGEQITNIPQLKEYLLSLSRWSNQTISPEQLFPDFETFFPWAYRLPKPQSTRQEALLETLWEETGWNRNPTNIQLYKTLSEKHGISLKEAKNFVDLCRDKARNHHNDYTYYIALQLRENPASLNGICEVQLYTDGPNMGSAGGPTLQTIGSLAEFSYSAVLNC